MMDPRCAFNRRPRDAVAVAADNRASRGRPEPHLRRIALVKTAPFEEAFIELLAQACPHLPPAQVRTRFVATMGILVFSMNGSDTTRLDQ